MVNIGRNEVSGFQYSSSMSATAQTIISMGTTAVENDSIKKIYITDFKAVVGTSTRTTVKLYSHNYEGAGEVKPLEFDLPGNSVTDFRWELPYEMIITGTTGENRSFVASAGNVGVKYSLSGYIER